MADNNKPHDFEEEFDFDTDESDIDDIFEEDDSKSKKRNNPFLSSESNSKFTLPILIGVAVAIFIGWKLYGFLFPTTPDAQLDKIAAQEAAAISQSNKAAINTPTQAPVVIRPEQVQPALPTPTTPIAPPPEAGPAIPGAGIAPQMAPQIGMNAQSQEEIKNLENTINQVMDSLNKMDQKISLIGREFFAVSDNVTRLSQEVAQLKSAKKSTPPAAPQKIIHKPRPQATKKAPVYHVDQPQDEDLIEEPTKVHTQKAGRTQRKTDFVIHAIIPGRAWLRAADGSTLTVTQGDTIPGYGKAMVIDAPSASVVTSSGVVLR